MSGRVIDATTGGTVLKNGIVVSASHDRQKLDVLVKGTRITRVEPDIPVGNDMSVIDATGLVVAPGFVNIHAHDDFYVGERDQAEILRSICFQGITASACGNCGISNYPSRDGSDEDIESYQGFLHFREPHRIWSDLDSFASAVSGHMAIHQIPLIGHGTLRVQGNRFDRALSGSAEEYMRRSLLDFVEQGGYGLSTGLMYMPGVFSDTDEIIGFLDDVSTLCGPSIRDQFIYASHLRGYSDTFLDSVREAIEIGERTGFKVQCSHLGPFGVQYRDDLLRGLDLIESASQRGVRVCFDTLAYCGGSTTIMALVPPWLYQKGLPAFLEDLRDDEFFARLIQVMETYVPQWPSWKGEGWTDNFVHCLGWDNLIVLSATNHRYAGKSLPRIGEDLGCSTQEAFRQVLLEERGAAVMLMAGVGTCLEEDDSEMWAFDRMVEHPQGRIAIDAIFNQRGRTMPYAYGSFPKIIRRYVNEKRTLTLQEAVRKFTTDVYAEFGITDRGDIRPGMSADIVVFDQANMRDYPDYFADDPKLATGVKHLMVDGALIIEDTHYHPDRADSGQVLLRR